MPRFVNCDDPDFPENLETDICGISHVKWEISAFFCGLLLALEIFMLYRWKYRNHKTLLTFHNLRAALTLLLLAINSLELARAFLPLPDAYNYNNDINNNSNGSNNNNNSNNSNSNNNTVSSNNMVDNATNNGYGSAAVVVAEGSEVGSRVIVLNGSAINLSLPVINYQQANERDVVHGDEVEDHFIDNEDDIVIVIVGSSTLLNAILATMLTLMLMSYHRVVEVKNTIEFIYVSATMEIIISILRVYEFSEVVYNGSYIELEACLQLFTAICLLGLGITDGYTIHKERYRPVYYEDYEKIGYKHSLATFYSKACFWWLTPLLWFGYKEPLELEDLGQMRVEDSARAYYDRFLLIYKTAKVLETDPPPSLWLCYLVSSWRMFTLGGLLKLFGDLFALIGPLAIQQIVQYIEGMYSTLPGSPLQGQQKPPARLHPKMYNDSSNSNQSAGNSSIILQGLEYLQNRSIRAVAAGSIIASVNPYSNSNFNNNIINNNNDDDGNNNIFLSRYEAIDAIAGDNDGTNYNSAEVQIYNATWSDLVSNGWAIAWIVLLAALAQGGLSQASTHILNMTGIRIKTSLQGLIYRKTLLLNSNCINVDNNNKGKSNNAAAEQQHYEKGEQPQKPPLGDTTLENVKNAGDTLKSAGLNEGLHSKNVESNKDNGAGSKNGSANDSKTDAGTITNLMSEDTLNIMSFFWIVHYVWAIPLKIAVVMFLLYLKLGISAVIGSFVCILTLTPLQFLIGKAMSSNTEKVSKYTDERLRKIHDTICGIKLIKLNAWDDVFMRKIRAARDKELHYLNKDSIYWTLMTILTHVSTVLITFVTLAVYVQLEETDSNELSASRLFSALALFQQLTVPLLIFPITVPIIISAVVSTRRIERFLLCAEVKKEFQGIRNMAHILSRSDASLDMYEEKREKPLVSQVTYQDAEVKDTVLNIIDSNVMDDRANKKLKLRMPLHMAPLAQSEPQTPLILNDAIDPPIFTFQPPSPCTPAELSSSSPPNLSPLSVSVSTGSVNKSDSDDCNECKRRVLLRNTPYVLIRPRNERRNMSRSLRKQLSTVHRDSILLKMPEGVAVSLRQALFAWDPRQMINTLSVNAMDIPRGQLSIIVGKNGSGKTSLLSALLMEMPHVSGDLIWNKTSTFAYVPQQPWLLNASIRQNILFGEHFRPKRYEFVLEACALKSDIDIMPDGDATVIGERGINLSGGQRQRIAIARALYSSANVVIMDDPLSSLDNEVARHIFEQSIRKMLLKANRTVILVTQQLNLVHQADYLIVMKNGRLQAAGSYKNIEAEHPNIVHKWNQIIAKANEKEEYSSSTGRTARERWKLFKNVTRMGLQRSVSTVSATSSVVASKLDIDETTAENESMSVDGSQHTGHTSGSFRLRPKRSSIYGSRHLIYDVPLPIDECQTDDVIIRRQRPRRANSHSSSRRSTCSNNSVASNNNNTAEIDGKVAVPSTARSLMTGATISSVERTQRGQSWQPQATPSCNHHKKVARNISSPGSMQTECPQDVFRQASAAAIADGIEWQEEQHEIERAQNMGSFQQFMRRMSSRRSNMSKAKNRIHRPVSATNSILSISEESTSLPSIEIATVATESSSWITNIEDEEPISDANIDYDDSLQQPQQVDVSKQEEQQLKQQQEGQRQSLLKNPNGYGGSSTTTITTTATTATPAAPPSLSPDVERKYGKIPAKIYLLYLSASGYPIVLTFFTTALIWQCLRIYTDVWLQHWTDDKGMLDTAVVTSVGGIEANTTFATSKNDGPLTVTSFAMNTMAETSSTFKFSPIDDGDIARHGDKSLLSPTTMHHEVTYYFHVYALISCVCILMALISTPAGQLAGCNARRNLHDQLLTAIMSKSLHFFQVSPLGRIMNRFGNDMAIIDKKIAATSQRLLQFTLLCLCAVLINVTITPWFILLTVPICIAYYAIQKFYRCSSRELQRIENFTNTPVISHLSETIQGVTTIRAYNQEARFTEILFRRLEANTIAFTILNTSNRWLGISLDYLGGFIVFVAVVIALLAATISYRNLATSYEASNILNSHNGSGSSSSIKNFKDISAAAATIDPATPSPSASLVGLAINYTLLVPIYLNWVVKLLADMEMYIGSVERIAYYTEAATTIKTKGMSSENGKETETATGRRAAAHAANECRSNAGKSTVASIKSTTTTNTTGTNATAAKRTIQEVAASSSVAQHEINDDDDAAVAASDRCTHQKHQQRRRRRHVANNRVHVNNDNNVNDDDDDDDVGANDDDVKLKSSFVVCVEDDDGEGATLFSGAANDVSHDAAAVAVGDGSDVDVADKLLVVDDEIVKFADASKAVVDRAAAVNARITREDQLATTTTTTSAAKTKADTLPCQMERNDVVRTPSLQRACNGTIYKKVPISWPQRGDISFENVSLRYEGQHKDVITNLTLKIPAGQRIGICGRTGSGKSSLALSLFGVLQTTGGRTLIDDVDITQIHPDEIRSRLSIIPQDVHLFNATIRENLDPPGYYSDLALWNCLELAQLKEIVNNEMPQGLDTEILDGGVNLSSGHRQLFCLARAILRGSVCLVLDEATSSLDSSTERALLDAAHRAFQGRTILTIAHRLSTILNYDRIIVMENGKIIEDGSPEELQQRKDGAFYSLLHSGRSLSMNREADAMQP